ncbi:ferrous iron transporter B [Balneolales bacterium ANBcel1]|nr:ferrous iron transporter B [Balneolales bacterium ANBcel1]
MRILLMGNPNVGKSAIFSHLTGTHVSVSNYSGTTVEYASGTLALEQGTAELIDTPGTFSMNPANKAEEAAVAMLGDADVIINVTDAGNLERNLYLTLQLLQTGKPVMVVLNMWDEARKKRIKTDTEKLEKRLGVPVIPTSAISGEGIAMLKSRLPEARPGTSSTLPGKDLWKTSEQILRDTQQSPPESTSARMKLDHSTVHPVWGPAWAALVMLLSFLIVAVAGDALHDLLGDLFEFLWLPVATLGSNLLGGSGIVHNIIIGELIDGKIDFDESFGLITTGLYIPLAVVLPFIFSFYVVLSILEDVGYLPRLGVVVDNLMQRMGIQGASVVPMMLGIGCNVPGVMAGRMLETRRERLIVATLIAIVVPCVAQQAMVIGLLGKAGAIGLVIVYATLFLLWILLGWMMNLFLKGEPNELLIDLPPYRLPYWPSLVKKNYMRMSGFVRGALPYVLLGVLVVNLFYTLGLISYISDAFAPVITGLFGLPGEAGAALIVGFLRKDVAVGMLAPLGMELQQLIVASVVLMVYFPCVATFVVLFKELGLRDLLVLIGIMVVIVLITGGGLNLLLHYSGI